MKKNTSKWEKKLKNKKLTLCNGEPSAPSSQRPLSAVKGYYVLTELWGHDVVPLQNLSYTSPSSTPPHTHILRYIKNKIKINHAHPLTFML